MAITAASTVGKVREKFPQRVLRVPGDPPQQGHGFRDHGPHRGQRVAERAQGSPTAAMIGVRTVEQGDERSGINEDDGHGGARPAAT